MKGKRKYLGRILVDKVYQGPKALDWVINDHQGKELVKLVMAACRQANKFDLKVDPKPRKKDQKYTLTVTYASSNSFSKPSLR